MSTRSLVRFATREEGVSFSEHPERVEVQVYKHYDGYPSGHPVDLAEFLKDFKIPRCIKEKWGPKNRLF